MKIRTSEVFASTFQGEGRYTGVSSAWVRFFGCNKSCRGFGQTHPESPDTYVIRPLDISQYKKMEDLPVLEYGCDSDYSVSAKYKHLTTDYTEITLADKIYDLLPFKTFNTELHSPDLCFTGGEPMLNQKAIITLVDELIQRTDHPKRIQIETNGTVPLTEAFEYWARNGLRNRGIKLAFNISPKLLHVSGEADSVDLAVIQSYADLANTADLKFVMSTYEKAWKELDQIKESVLQSNLKSHLDTDQMRLMVMPMGASKEQQEADDIKLIVNRAIKEGYHISVRAHAYVFGNAMAT
jgi:organic radical activating enzyme